MVPPADADTPAIVFHTTNQAPGITVYPRADDSALPDFWLLESPLREHLLRRLADGVIGIQQRLLQ